MNDKDQLHQLIDAWLNGNLSETEADQLSDRLREDKDARDLFLQMSDIHANLSVDETLWQAPVEAISAPSQKLLPIAAILTALLLLGILLNRPADDPAFATMKQSRAAFWESGNLPTADGSRLAQGTLRLAEGLATIKFDSGAEVVLEAPATLILIDAMKCELTSGTAVSDIPDSALGFRIKTPSADVVDYGTRFAVNVDEGSGATHTQVIEGKVQVEYAESNIIVELNTGQRNVVTGGTVGEATTVTNQEFDTLPFKPLDHGPDWTLLQPVKDAYTGHVKNHDSDTLLCVKRAIDGGQTNRASYIGFSMDNIDQPRIAAVELLLYFSPTGWGLASHVPDATFSVYGLTGDVPEWDESILHSSFPGSPEQVHLGSFTIPQGVQKGRFGIQTDELLEFLQQHPTREITLKVVRDTRETEGGGLVHGFASRRHPILPAPTLAIREAGL